jgi:UDP-glucose:glycoprotein glucosyltransferase
MYRAEISPIQVYPGDHLYGKHSHMIDVQNIPGVILYAVAGSKQFIESHSLLKKLSRSSKIEYIFRYLVLESSEPLHLSSYGVELAIKSLEYKVMDDSKLEGQGSSNSICLTLSL